jgi:hypothetical protein
MKELAREIGLAPNRHAATQISQGGQSAIAAMLLAQAQARALFKVLLITNQLFVMGIGYAHSHLVVV